MTLVDQYGVPLTRAEVAHLRSFEPHGSRWYAGCLRSEEGIRRHRAATRLRSRRHNPLRVGTSALDYVGRAPTPEQAAALNDEMRAFTAAQKGRTE